MEKIEKFFLVYSPFDWIAHEAGQVAVTSSLTDPIHDFNSNALATFNLLEAVRKYSPEAKIAFTSTNKVYGKLLDLELELRINTDSKGFNCNRKATPRLSISIRLFKR